MSAETPNDEQARLDALYGYGILDTPPEQLYDEITQLAAQICGVPISAISLIDEERQWFKSIVGLGVEETPRDVAFCAHTILEPDAMVVEDAASDPRFADNPLVLSDPRIRFYAGAPLITPDGHSLGSLCVIDTEPRELTEAQVDALRMLGRQVMTQLELRVKLEELARANAEREQTAARLEQAHRRLRSAVAGAPVILFALDRDGTVELSEGGGLELLGLEAGAVVGRSVFDLYADHPQHLGLVRRALAGERVCEDVTIGRVVLESSYCPLVDEAGEVTGIVGLSCDITERVRADSELLRTNAQLDRSREQALEASRLKSAFVANMSHEIRTPLNGVIGMTELLLDTHLTEDQREYGTVAVSSAEALLAVIDDILDFSKIEAGKLALDAADFSPRDTIADVCKMLSVAADEKGLELVCSGQDQIPATVRGDEARFRQVLTNLMSNAVKFTSLGRVAVEVSATRQADQEVLLRVEVTDTGIGIDPSQADELFDPFHQADVSTTRRFGGTGLGLAISRELVELMDGEIGATSDLGHGSRFWFTAKLELRKDAGPEPPTPATAQEALRARVLVVEDNVVNQVVAQAMLSELGYGSVLAVNGADALERLAEGGFDAILMDCQMPVLDGYEATARIREGEGSGSRTPIIAMTAHAMEGDRERCLGAGMDDYIAKPVRNAVFREVLERWVPRTPSTSAADERRQPSLSVDG